MQDRGQALTLEGSLAAMMIVLSLVFALQVSAVTPLTESTSSQHIENQQKEVGENVLAIAAADGTLKSTVLYWNEDAERYNGTNVEAGEVYTSGIPTTADAEDNPSVDPEEHEDVVAFGDLLDRTFSDRGIAYNLHVSYVEDGEQDSEKIVDQGQPSDHAVSVTQVITLYEDDVIYTDGTTELTDSNTFYIDNQNDGTPVYNVVQVELVVWRM